MRRPERVIVHVGMAKAGSTLIQNALAARHGELLARGVLFPLSVLRRGNPFDPSRTPGHLDLLTQLAQGAPTPFHAEWEAAGEGVATLVLSVENLFNLVGPDRPAALARLLAGCEVTLIAILRAQDEWLASRYYEAVTTGQANERRSFDRYALASLDERWLDYPACLEALAACFAAREVIALDYGTLREGGALLPAFLRAARLPLEVTAEEAGRPVNPSVAFPESIEAHRRLNLLARTLPQEARYRFGEAMKDHYRGLAVDGVLRARPLEPSRSVRRRILEAVAEPNRRLAEAHLGGVPFGPDGPWVEADATPLDEGLVAAIHEAGVGIFLEACRPAPAADEAASQSGDRAAAGPPAAGGPTPSRRFLRAPEEGALVREACARARCVLAYGASWPVSAMAGRPGRLLFVVEEDAAAAMALQALLDRAETPSPVVAYPFEEEGPDIRRLASAIWEEPFFRHPDLVLIAGRHRLACLAATALHARRPVTALVDEYPAQPERHAVEEALGAPRLAGRLAAFDLDPSAIPQARAARLLDALAGGQAALEAATA